MKGEFLLTIVIMAFLTNVGCTGQISVDEALTDEYLSMSPEKYLGRDKHLRSADMDTLNNLFLNSFEKNNFDLAGYYRSVGAEINEVEFDREEFIRTFAQNPLSEEKKLLLQEALLCCPELLFWEIKRNNGTFITALALFSYELSLDDFRMVVGYCEDLDQPGPDGKTVLLSLVVQTRNVENKKEKIEILLEKGVDLSVVDFYGSNILHYFKWWPIEEDYSDVLEIIKKSNPDFNKKDRSGDTPLISAVHPFGLSTNSVLYVQYLLENDAKTDIRNNYGMSALNYVYTFGKGSEGGRFKYSTEEEIVAYEVVMEELIELLEF